MKMENIIHVVSRKQRPLRSKTSGWIILVKGGHVQTRLEQVMIMSITFIDHLLNKHKQESSAAAKGIFSCGQTEEIYCPMLQ